MFRHVRRTAVLFAILPLLTATPSSAQPQTVGLFVNDPGAFAGYTLFGPRDWPVTYLIDMNGELVHSWQHTYVPKNVVYLLDDGTLVRSARTENDVFQHQGSAGRLQRWDWDGTLLWEYIYSDSQVCGHHDVEPMPDGNLLVVAWEYKSVAEAVAAGRDPALLRDALWPDHVVEIEPVGTSGANIVWEWHAWDHLIQDFDSTKANYGVVADHPELINVNETPSDNQDWLHFNTVAYDEDLDQVVVSVNRLQEIWVIDHGTTTAEAAGHTGGAQGMGGDLLYRWGNPANYGRGTIEDQRLFSQHNIHWIPPGLPGAGNLLVFNNGRNRWPPTLDYSSIEEIGTPVDSAGGYPTLGPGEAHEPADALWTYTAPEPTDFSSGFFGGVQRQPNGNTLIIESAEGRIFEIDSTETIVWEYVIPIDTNGPMYQYGDPAGENASFRATRFAPDHPALAGRDLTPQGPIERDPTAVALGGEPVRFSLEPNHPNPFHPSTAITFSLRDPAFVALDVYDVTGRHVETLVRERLGIGRHSRTWSAAGRPSGVYYYALRAGAETRARPMVLLR